MLAELILHIAVKLGRRQYVDYYLREGYSVESINGMKNEALTTDEVYDIFDTLAKILLNPHAIKGIYGLHGRSKFIIGFFQLLNWG